MGFEIDDTWHCEIGRGRHIGSGGAVARRGDLYRTSEGVLIMIIRTDGLPVRTAHGALAQPQQHWMAGCDATGGCDERGGGGAGRQRSYSIVQQPHAAAAA
eukprot:COSAG01_NODE_15983_length_1280_cov_7.733277_2_plen_101_part_00